MQEAASVGDSHVAKPRHDTNSRSRVCVLDLPLPQTLVWQPMRCDTCRRERKGQGSFAVLDEDILQAAPNVLWHDPKKRKIREKSIFFTKEWLLHILQNFSECLSAREVRRSLMQTYSANCLTRQLGNRLLPFFDAIPPSNVLRSLILEAFDGYLDKQVREIQRLVCLYSGQIVRSDGHWKLARRVFCKARKGGQRRPYTTLFLGLTSS